MADEKRCLRCRRNKRRVAAFLRRLKDTLRIDPEKYGHVDEEEVKLVREMDELVRSL